MRSYAKIFPQFWIGETGKKIKALGTDTRLVAMYLMTSPHANMLGIYYLPIEFIAHEVGLSVEGASKGLQGLCDIQFCSYDKEREYVYVHNMAHFQVGESLKPNDHQVKAVNKLYQSLPKLSFLKDFFQKYQHQFHLNHKQENEASEYIAMSRSFLRQDRMNGIRQKRTAGPHYIKIGRSIRYLKEDLDKWLNQHKIERTYHLK